MNTEIDHKAHIPMVLLHGYVSALAFWLLNLDGKSQKKKNAFDCEHKNFT